MRAVIICGGEIGNAERARAHIQKDDMIICADSGYKYAGELGVEADAVLGDFDSYKREKILCENVRVYPQKKDYTDSEIAAQYAVERGADTILLLAATGGRLDHSLGNIYLLKTLCEQNVSASIFDGASELRYVNDEASFCGKKGDVLSLIPFAEADDFVTEGLEYALEHEPLPSTGISNVFTENEVRVRVGNGGVIAVYTPGELCR